MRVQSSFRTLFDLLRKNKATIRKRLLIYILIMAMLFPFVFIYRVEIYRTFLSDFDDEQYYYTEDGLLVTDYGYQNRQYIGEHITVRAVSNTAIAYYDQWLDGNATAGVYFNNSIDFILDTINTFEVTDENGTRTISNWPYNFSIYGLPEGWVSGMADAKALHALSLAYEAFGYSEILDIVNQVAGAFETLVENGGNLYILDDRTHWYPEIVISPDLIPNYKPPLILNGFLFALHHIYQANLVFNNSRLTNIFNLGIESAVQNIHLYDSPYNWTLYHIDYPMKLASRDYHQIHINLCNHLYNYTNEPIFQYYANRWSEYTGPPAFTWEELVSPEFIGNGLLMAAIIFFPLLFVDILQTVVRRKIRSKEIESGVNQT
ncbi:MAG: D-glucuronyl C5-epimerase family protein [Candidatus Thorarchaeota archaeon]